MNNLRERTKKQKEKRKKEERIRRKIYQGTPFTDDPI